MDKQTKQRLIIGGTLFATIIILFLLLKKKSIIPETTQKEITSPYGNITMPGLGPIGFNSIPPLVYNPPDIGDFDFGIDYIARNPNGSLGLTNNMPIEHGTGKSCQASTQPPLVLYSGGGGSMASFNNDAPAPSNTYLPFAWGR